MLQLRVIENVDIEDSYGQQIRTSATPSPALSAPPSPTTSTSSTTRRDPPRRHRLSRVHRLLRHEPHHQFNYLNLVNFVCL